MLYTIVRLFATHTPHIHIYTCVTRAHTRNYRIFEVLAIDMAKSRRTELALLKNGKERLRMFLRPVASQHFCVSRVKHANGVPTRGGDCPIFLRLHAVFRGAHRHRGKNTFWSPPQFYG